MDKHCPFADDVLIANGVKNTYVRLPDGNQQKIVILYGDMSPKSSFFLVTC
jgi:hypothetical protein